MNTNVLQQAKSEAVAATPDSCDEFKLVPPLLSIAKSTRAFLALLLAEAGLHPGQDQLLDRLEPNVALSVSALAEQLAVRPSTVSKMLDRLIEKDLVTRASSHRDARRTMVTLTEKGRQARILVHATWARLEVDLAGSLTQNEAASLAASLRKADELLSARLRRLR